MRKQIYVNISSAILLSFFSLSVLANDGDATFQSSQIHIVQITCWQTSFWDSLLHTHSTDTSIGCNINIDGIQLDSVGIKIKGNSSFNSYPGVKKSFKISFDEYHDTLKFDGLKTINLNNDFKDPTLLREKLFLDFLRAKGLPAPRCTYAKVYINGTYWGLYDLVEQVNKTFLNDLIGNKDGNLFKGDPQGDLHWLGSTASSYYTKYELKTNDSLNDWTDLVHLVDKINNTPSAQFHDSLETVLNTTLFMQQWAASILFANLDSYQGSGHNYYIYHNTASGTFDWITWDVNEAFGNFNQGMNVAQVESMSYSYVPSPSNSRPLISKMLGDSTYKYQYIAHLCNFLKNDFTTDILFPEIDTLANRIRTDYYADPNKMYTNQQFEDALVQDISVVGPGGNAIPGLKSFITNRRASLVTELSALGCVVSGTREKYSQRIAYEIVPNPFRNSAQLITHESEPVLFPGVRLQVFDVLGRKCLDEKISSLPFLLECPGLPAGIYYYLISGSGDTHPARKFVLLN